MLIYALQSQIEFIHWWHRNHTSPVNWIHQESIRRMNLIWEDFKYFDQDQSGQIDKREFPSLLNYVGARGPSIRNLHIPVWADVRRQIYSN